MRHMHVPVRAVEAAMCVRVAATGRRVRARVSPRPLRARLCRLRLRRWLAPECADGGEPAAGEL
eukprot:6210492-Pleurochrysis_carterae.AAC.1